MDFVISEESVPKHLKSLKLVFVNHSFLRATLTSYNASGFMGKMWHLKEPVVMELVSASIFQGMTHELFAPFFSCLHHLLRHPALYFFPA